jgi:hypothetical protein
MSWHFRVVEVGDRQWQCRWGVETYDEHQTITDALDHIRIVAAEHGPATFFVHRRSGSVERLGDVIPIRGRPALCE